MGYLGWFLIVDGVITLISISIIILAFKRISKKTIEAVEKTSFKKDFIEETVELETVELETVELETVELETTELETTELETTELETTELETAELETTELEVSVPEAGEVELSEISDEIQNEELEHCSQNIDLTNTKEVISTKIMNNEKMLEIKDNYKLIGNYHCSEDEYSELLEDTRKLSEDIIYKHRSNFHPDNYFKVFLTLVEIAKRWKVKEGENDGLSWTLFQKQLQVMMKTIKVYTKNLDMLFSVWKKTRSQS